MKSWGFLPLQITIAAFKRCTANAYRSGRPDTLIQPKLLSKPAWSKAAETRDEIRSIHFSINAESSLYNRNRISQEACGLSRKPHEKLSAVAGKVVCHSQNRCYQRNSGQGRHPSAEDGFRAAVPEPWRSPLHVHAFHPRGIKRNPFIFYVLIGLTQQCDKLEFGGFVEWNAGGCRTPKGSPV